MQTQCLIVKLLEKTHHMFRIFFPTDSSFFFFFFLTLTLTQHSQWLLILAKPMWYLMTSQEIGAITGLYETMAQVGLN